MDPRALVAGLTMASDAWCCGGCRLCTALWDALTSATTEPEAPAGLTQAQRDSIRQSLWRLRQDLEELNVPTLLDDLAGLLDGAFGGPAGFVAVVRGWARLIDGLVLETEHTYGRQSGRGALKKRSVKAALLYLVHRTDIQVPKLPAVLAPFVWDILLDSLIDLFAQFSNRQQRWGAVPAQESGRQRLQLEAQRVGTALDWLVQGLTRLAWKLVFLASPVNPRMKRCVDEFLAVDPQPVQTVFVLVRWVAGHTGTLVVASDLLVIAIEQGRFFVHADAAQQRAYALEVVLEFIQQEMNIESRDTLRFRVIKAVVEVGIELVAMLLDGQGSGPPAAVPALQTDVPASG